MSTVSFEKQIKPVLQQYEGQMIWRFELTKYEDVKQNASIIKSRIESTDPSGVMPPPPFAPFDKDFIALFLKWVDDGCPP